LIPRAKNALYTFRLRMAKTGPQFVHAYVFRDAKDLRAFCAAAGKSHRTGYWEGTEGIAHHWLTQRRVAGRWRRGPDQGLVGFHISQTGAGVLAHEFAHLASFTAKTSRFKPGSPAWEERMAWTCGWLMHQFTKKAYASGLYRRRSRMK
jgi:hypothetical protein